VLKPGGYIVIGGAVCAVMMIGGVLCSSTTSSFEGPIEAGKKWGLLGVLTERIAKAEAIESTIFKAFPGVVTDEKFLWIDQCTAANREIKDPGRYYQLFGQISALAANAWEIEDDETAMRRHRKEMVADEHRRSQVGSADVQGPDRGSDQEQRHRGHPLDRGDRVRPVDGLGVCGGVHAGVKRDLRGGGGPLDHQAASSADAGHARPRVLLALVLVALVLTGPLASKVGSAVGIGSSAVAVWNIAKWPVLLIVVMFMIALLYYASPNAKLRQPEIDLPRSSTGRRGVAGGVRGVRVLCRELRLLQQDLRHAGRNHHLPGLDVDHQRRDPPGR
jgi:hypothetical protein